MHACLTLPGGAKLFAGDIPPGMPYEGVKGVMLAIQYDTVDQAHGAFHALSQGRPGDDATGARVLGQDLRHAHRSLRGELGRQWRTLAFA